MEKIITYFGQRAKIACDEKCHKAWGSNGRPRVYLDIGEDIIFGLDGEIYPENEDEIDIDEWAYLSDDELPDAPFDTGNYEGFEACGKPASKEDIPNKWCVRECERCQMSAPGEWYKPLELPDFSKRFYNSYPHTRDS